MAAPKLKVKITRVRRAIVRVALHSGDCCPLCGSTVGGAPEAPADRTRDDRVRRVVSRIRANGVLLLLPMILSPCVEAQDPPTHRAVLESFGVKSHSFCSAANRVDTQYAYQPPGPITHNRFCTGSRTEATFTVTAPAVIGNGRQVQVGAATGYRFDDAIQVNASVFAVVTYPMGTVVASVTVPISDSTEFTSNTSDPGTCTRVVATNTAVQGSVTARATNNCARNPTQTTLISGGKLIINSAAFVGVSRTGAIVPNLQAPAVALEVDLVYRIESLVADLAFDHMEVVQVVQAADNSVPIIQGKPTVVRVFPKLAKPGAGVPPIQPGVTAELRGFFRGVELRLSPLLPFNGPVNAVAAPRRENVDDSLNFRLPHFWAALAAITLTAEIKPPGTNPDPTPPDNRGTVSIVLRPSPSMSVAYMPLCLQPEGLINPLCPNAASIARHDVILEKIFPIAPANLNYTPLPVAQRIYSGRLGTQLDSYLRRFYDLFASGYDQLAVWLPDLLTRINYRITGSSDPIWYTADPGKGRVSWQQDWTASDPLYPADTLAHEVAHNLGRRHTHRVDSCGARDPETDWPVDFARSNIQEPGFDPILRAIKLPSLFDLMTYCSPPVRNKWISPFTYQQLIQGGLKPQNEPDKRLADGEWIVIGGMAKRDGSGGSILPGYRVSGMGPTGAPPISPTHCLRFFGDAGAVLGEQCLALTFRDHRFEEVTYDEEWFAVKALFPAGTMRIGLFAGSRELASLRPGPAVPVLTIQSPRTGDVWNGGSRTIAWTATDADNDPLTYSVLYSSDSGANWITMEIDLTATNFTFDSTQIDGGRAVLFRVLATDGIRTAAADVGPIDVVQAPRIAATPDRLDARKVVLRQVRDLTVTVTNSGTGPMRITALTSSLEDEFEILTRAPLVIPADQSREIAVRFSPLQTGVREGRMTVASSDPARPSVEVVLTGRGITTAEPDLDVPAQIDFGHVAAGASKDITLAIRNAGGLFLTVNTLTLNNAAFRVVSPAQPIGVDAGATRIVTLRFTAGAAGAQAGQLTITSTDPIRAQVVLPITATVVAGMVPAASAAGVVSAASFLGGPVAAGQIVTIFGTTIGPPSIVGLSLNAQGLVDTTVGETRVLFDGVPAPMIYALAGQTSVIVPYAVAGRTTTQMIVEYQGRRSDPVTLPVAPSAPGLFSANSSGRGPAAILNQDSSVNTGENPADKGSVVVLFGTGEGRTEPDGVDGRLAATVFPKPRLPVSVRIGGAPAEVLYAGAAPGLVAGVFQINARIPEGVVSGAVPVVVTVGSAASQPELTVAVK